VVHPRAALGEELADRSLHAERCHQLDAALADPDRDRLDALVRERPAMLDAGAEEPLVGPDCVVEVFDCDAEVMDPQGLHGPDAT
jgi:hypothetical protein